MMNLSNEICKLCNVEPLNDETAYFTGNLGKLPDLTKPNNFVKLLNILYRCGVNHDYDFQLAGMSFEEDNIYHEQMETFEELHLFCVYTRLNKNYDSWDDKFIKIIKEKIKNTNWEY